MKNAHRTDRYKIKITKKCKLKSTSMQTHQNHKRGKEGTVPLNGLGGGLLGQSTPKPSTLG